MFLPPLLIFHDYSAILGEGEENKPSKHIFASYSRDIAFCFVASLSLAID